MPRPDRVFFDGAVYHVYNRVARGEKVFEDEHEISRFVALLKEVTTRDQVTVFAWCVMANHFHVALRTGPVSLDRPMRSLQQRFTRSFNARHRVFGPLWQGRYRAKLVKDQRYLDRLLAYIHLNPVTAGLVKDPADYAWSGHRELLGRTRDPVVNVDEVLRLFAANRRNARARYVRAIKGAEEASWVGESPGRLPWWRLGRPGSSTEEADPEHSGRLQRSADAARQLRERPRLTEETFLERGAAHLGVSVEDLAGRGKVPETVRARELLACLGVERYGLTVKKLATALDKHPVTASGWVMRGVHRRRADPLFRKRLEALDESLSEGP